MSNLKKVEINYQAIIQSHWKTEKIQDLLSKKMGLFRGERDFQLIRLREVKNKLKVIFSEQDQHKFAVLENCMTSYGWATQRSKISRVDVLTRKLKELHQVHKELIDSQNEKLSDIPEEYAKMEHEFEPKNFKSKLENRTKEEAAVDQEIKQCDNILDDLNNNDSNNRFAKDLEAVNKVMKGNKASLDPKEDLAMRNLVESEKEFIVHLKRELQELI